MLLFIAVLRFLFAVISSVAEHRRSCTGLSNYSSQAKLVRGKWDLPGPGIEPVSPALAGGFFTTETPGSPILNDFNMKGPPDII